MAKTITSYFDELRGTRVWRSVFRSGTGSSTLHRALAVQQNVFLHLFSTKVRTRMVSFSTTWYLGTLTFGTFLILVITGIPLMLYYHPSVPQAYADTKDLQFVVSSGLFLRNLHRWSAHAMVFLVFAHMFKVFYRGAYRPPREFNWVIGVILLLITLLLSYTGYLLPWDQLAFWAITVGSNIASAVPVFGNKVHFLMLGGNQVNANALLRFYVLHCMILPLVAILFIAVHFWRIRKDGGLYAHQSEPKTLAAQPVRPRRRRRNPNERPTSERFHRRPGLERAQVADPRSLRHPPHLGAGQSYRRRPGADLSGSLLPRHRRHRSANDRTGRALLSCSMRRSRASPIPRIRRIPRKRPGTFSDCRKCCTTFRRSSRECWFRPWSSSRSS